MGKATISLPEPPGIMTPADPFWPSGLADLPNPPLWLRKVGDIPDTDRAVAIVGTRYADEDARQFARQLAFELSRAGLTIISGGAHGIDAEAHQGALDASGRTIAVLATGLRQAYPKHHAPLFGRIAANGALLTEALDDQAPVPGLFLKRNRLVAALADAVVVVQAPLRSGAMSTASWAKSIDRTLFAVPAAPWDTRGEGCLRLIGQGAMVCTSARDVLSVRSPQADKLLQQTQDSGENPGNFEEMDVDEQCVLRAMGRVKRYPDEIARKAGLPVSRVQRALLTLNLRGTVEESSGGKYVKIVR